MANEIVLIKDEKPAIGAMSGRTLSITHSAIAPFVMLRVRPLHQNVGRPAQLLMKERIARLGRITERSEVMLDKTAYRSSHLWDGPAEGWPSQRPAPGAGG